MFTSLSRVLHLLVGFSIALAMCFASKDPIIGFACGTLVGAIKEHYNQVSREILPVWSNFLLVTAGSVMGTAWYLLF